MWLVRRVKSCGFSGQQRRRRKDDLDGRPLPHWQALTIHHRTKIVSCDGQTIEVWEPLDYQRFWNDHLTPKEFDVLRKQATEPPRSSIYHKFYPDSGFFACRACGLALYSYQSKINPSPSTTSSQKSKHQRKYHLRLRHHHLDWPSFGACYQGNLATRIDFDRGMRRLEIVCRRCRSHLGHVFTERRLSSYDRNVVFTERHCVNGIAIKYIKEQQPGEQLQRQYCIISAKALDLQK